MTIEEAFNIIVEEKNKLNTLVGVPTEQVTFQSFLAELSTGKTSLWKTMAYLFAFGASMVSKLWERAKAELQDLADKSEPSTDAWLAEKARQFRWLQNPESPFPKNLYQVTVGSDNIPTWSQQALENDAALIVKFSAAETIGGSCLVKVNGESGGLPALLTGPQKDAVAEYIDRIQPPGAQVSVVCRPPDYLTINASIYYDALFGQGIADAVNAAIVAFLKTLPFNGLISRNYLEDAIQKVPGVVQVVLAQTKGRKQFDNFNSVAAIIFTRQYKTFAGCCVYDQANSNIQFFLA